MGLSWDARWFLLTDAVVPGGHRVDEFAAITECAGASVEGLPRFETTPEDLMSAPEMVSGSVLLLPGSASGATVRWGAFRALADALADAGRVPVFAGGPLEESWLPDLAGPHRCLPTLSLPAFACVASRVSAVVSNDSGLGHLATAARRALGADPACVHVVCGSTDPMRTAAPGAHHHAAGRGLACWPCDRNVCTKNLECLRTPVDALVELMQIDRRTDEGDAP